jgi:hypothetical protein
MQFYITYTKHKSTAVGNDFDKEQNFDLIWILNKVDRIAEILNTRSIDLKESEMILVRVVRETSITVQLVSIDSAHPNTVVTQRNSFLIDTFRAVVDFNASQSNSGNRNNSVSFSAIPHQVSSRLKTISQISSFANKVILKAYILIIERSSHKFGRITSHGNALDKLIQNTIAIGEQEHQVPKKLFMQDKIKTY